jgi:hypothetical protein
VDRRAANLAVVDRALVQGHPRSATEKERELGWAREMVTQLDRVWDMLAPENRAHGNERACGANVTIDVELAATARFQRNAAQIASSVPSGP